MNVNYNVNPVDTPVNAKLCDYSAEEIVVMDAQTEYGNGLRIDVSGKTFGFVRITGEFVADIILYGACFNGSGAFESLTAIHRKTEEKFKKITEAGEYYVDLSRYSDFMPRIDKYTSGAVTITVKLFTKPTNMFDEKNKQIAYAHSVHVSGGTYGEAIKTVSVSKFPFQYVAVRADSAHNFRVSLYYNHENMGSFGNANDDLFVLQIINKVRGVSDWIEAKGDYVQVYIYNDSGEEHSYDVYLNGVR